MLQVGNCGGDVGASTPGKITSPGYPRLHGENINCNWTISASEGKTVRLSVLDIDVGV